MATWSECGHILAHHGPLGVPVTCTQFDQHSELLWTGSAFGLVASHLGPNLQRYTRWKAHPGTSTGTRGILVDDKAVYSVGEGGVKAATRNGLTRWQSFAAAKDLPTRDGSGGSGGEQKQQQRLASMCFSPSSASDIVVGGDAALACIHSGTGSLMRSSPTDSPVVSVKKSAKLICAATSAGHIQLRDPRSLQLEHRLHAHPGGVIDMQADAHYVYSIGWTVRLGHPVAEPLVKVHDVRTMRVLVQLPFAAPGGPALMTVHPKRSTTVVVAAAQGQFQIVDINSPGQSTFVHIANDSSTPLTSMAMSQSADYLAFGLADGSLRLWSSSPSASRFNPFSTPAPEGPDLIDPLAVVNWTTETPLSIIGVPYYDSPLLSAIPYERYTSSSSPLFNMPTKIDGAILGNMRTHDNIGYAPLPRQLRGRRNVVLPTNNSSMTGSSRRRRVGVPLFRSEKRGQEGGNAAAAAADQKQKQTPTAQDEGAEAAMPSYYRVKTIEYSKFGVEDFDFGFFNQTHYSGLETHIHNSYANAYLQALNYLVPFRHLAETHAIEGRDCQRDECLLCQAGFLFKMLQDAHGANCQATNFLRAFGASDRAAALGLMDKDDSPSSDAAYSNLIQTLNRFLLDAVSDDDGKGAVWRLFENALATRTTCTNCGASVDREAHSLVVDLTYPRRVLSNELAPPSDFASVLRGSLLRETHVKAPCRSCQTPASMLRSRRILPETDQLPASLSINCAVHTAEHLSFWLGGTPQQPSSAYLPPQLSLSVQGEQVRAKGLWTEEDKAQEEQASASSPPPAIYTLRAIVVQVQADKDVPHLCALVKVPGAQWHIFNDFLVMPISEAEALSFPGPWKIPAVLFYERTDREAPAASENPKDQDADILCHDMSISAHRDPELIRHSVLTPDEIPSKGDLVAIDSEFVALNQEELELRSDGSRRLIRPSRLTLARVSVLRGQGPKEGEAFVDDYIRTREKIVDYLTQFSGIETGDLDPAMSKHTLVPLKVAYKKLRVLVDRGCVFVGHGLSKDFRIINIHVPPSQVIDTVDLYHSSTHPRKLSLRFLAWFLLKQDIQGPSNMAEGHDSIQDALAALKLYRLYQQFERENRLDDVLEDLYEAGRVHGWKPPSAAPRE